MPSRRSDRRLRPSTDRALATRSAGAGSASIGRFDSAGCRSIRGRHLPVSREPLEPRAGEASHPLELGTQRRGSGRGEPIRASPVHRLEGLDQAARLEPRERRVQRPRAERRTRDLLDVGHDRVAVLRPVAQRQQDVQRRLGESAQVRDLVGRLTRASVRVRLYRHTIYRPVSQSLSTPRGQDASAAASPDIHAPWTVDGCCRLVASPARMSRGVIGAARASRSAEVAPTAM